MGIENFYERDIRMGEDPFKVRDNPANSIKDSMWDFLKDGNQTANIPALKEAVYDLIQMATQKTAGQGRNKKDISFNNIDAVKMVIVCEAVALVLSGKLDGLS
jgi:hypothetical protein